ncbi:SDR family oxidoreductase [Bacteriovorax sp. Seq25_V]|uniref:SDR family NAD(P)-dependent oxidoreductase n=1 Tax=Bacteriovorax sp. Seq25_V TaxID=1201288 RepID=UPI00038A09ED|nr:SDR family NAD(P)-dependent oxidoreductase [Bacteriovorax sp. Seq25_V]EQC43907.1 KR domain protein [Bacteriovorax sp. Seq25_V]
MEKYALITGSSSGIGKAMAFELAKHGYSPLLHGRNIVELEKTRAEILGKHPSLKCEIIQANLSVENEIDKLISKIQNYDIEVFISNAGFGIPGNFENTELLAEETMISTHVSAIVKLTKYFYKSCANKERGYILNTSSLYSFFAVPKQSMYGATKAFQHSFFMALHQEAKLNRPHIYISSLCPGLTYSNFRISQGKKEKKSIVGMEAHEVATIAINSLFKNKPVIIPGIFSKMMAFVIPKLPIALQLSIIYNMNKQRGF